MIYTSEDLPKVVEQVKESINSRGLNVEDFDIDPIYSGNLVRVEHHSVDKGGFIIRMFGTNDFSMLEKELDEWIS